jgi:hypothetical protein
MTTLLSSIFGMELINIAGLTEMLTRFLLNSAFVFVIIHFFYYPRSHRRDYYFAFFMLSVSIFMMIYLMDGAKMKVGAALGLFAVFGIIRYRTESVPIREMTYLFFAVALSVINGMATKLSVVELIVANLLFVLVVTIAESNHIAKKEGCKFIRYDNIKLITPQKREELIEDLKQRTGLEIVRVEIGSIDFMNDTALIKVYYVSPALEENDVDTLRKMPKNYSDS